MPQGEPTPALTAAKIRDLDAKVRHLISLFDDMRINPTADRLVQSLMKLVRDNLLQVRQAAVLTEGTDLEILPLAMQLEEDMLNAEKLYAGRVAMANAPVG